MTMHLNMLILLVNERYFIVFCVTKEPGYVLNGFEFFRVLQKKYEYFNAGILVVRLYVL